MVARWNSGGRGLKPAISSLNGIESARRPLEFRRAWIETPIDAVREYVGVVARWNSGGRGLKPVALLALRSPVARRPLEFRRAWIETP